MSGNINPEEVSSGSSVSNSVVECSTNDLNGSSRTYASQSIGQDNFGTTETSTSECPEEPQVLVRRRRHILDAPLFDCPEGQARDFLGNCRPVI
ncbi:hypothetical protein J6590_012577 [Homalodisca vitripennis]|nr:hypothetical protein J6590_012577 [Homalodisca vitripennis]